MRITVLGAGRVGAAMVRDLAREDGFEILVADASEEALRPFARTARIRLRQADLSDPTAVAELVEGQDLAVAAVPGPMGFATAREVIESGTHLVDISFFEQDAFELDALARERGVTALVDCGVAPGASNLILGRLEASFERLDRFTCYVGGLPVERRWPFEYKAPFSPIDVIAEYTRPVRLREHGRTVVRPALGRPERLWIEGVGTLEAFETDGLRTLLRTSGVPHMVEKTLRYPGHREKMEVLRDAGFFSDEPLTLADGTKVRPSALTARLLFPLWQLEPDEDELTVMRIEVEGEETAGEPPRRHVYELLDRRDPTTGESSMARTTGYTCTAMVHVLAEGLYREPGVSPPELVGRDAASYERVMAHLAARNIIFRRRVETLTQPS
ncbi:MAG: saccharopine dehydrogenase NADP-binding domain-containing protein [Holophagales bacterium]|nr:saccharopine dehydrogenase NADP-binding domain-containing protein [Holophagales bacterium]